VNWWDFSSYRTKRIEKSFWASELLVTNGDDISIWEFELLFFSRGVFIFLHFFLEIKGNIAQFFFDISNNFEFGRGGESGSTFSEEFSEIFGEISTSEIVSLDSMWERVTLIDWDSMGNTITRIHNATSNSTRRVKRKDSLDSNVKLRNVEVLKEDLNHSFSVLLGVSWSFSKEGTLVIR